MRVEDFLRQSAKRFRGKTALIAGGTRLAYGEIDTASDRLAAALQRAGVAESCCTPAPNHHARQAKDRLNCADCGMDL